MSAIAKIVKGRSIEAALGKIPGDKQLDAQFGIMKIFNISDKRAYRRIVKGEKKDISVEEAIEVENFFLDGYGIKNPWQ